MYKARLINQMSQKGYRCIISFVYEGKEEIHNYMQYKVSLTLYGQDGKSKKSIKMAAIQKLHVRITKYFMCIFLGIKVHMCTTYEVCMFNPVACRGVHR